MKLISVGLLLTLILLEVLATAVLKSEKKIHLGILLYGVLAYLLHLYLKYAYEELSFANILWQVGNLLLVSFISILFFNEKFTKNKIIGLIFIILGIGFYKLTDSL